MRRAITFAIWAAAVLALAVAVISSSNAVAPRAGESTFSQDGEWNQAGARAPLDRLQLRCNAFIDDPG
jgi:hypothetical protein